MLSTDIVEVLKMVHEVFPLPVRDDFKGTHALTLLNHDGNEYLAVRIWYVNKENKVFGRDIYFLNEEVSKEELEAMKDKILGDT